MQPGETALQDLQHVGDHRPARRSHNADAPWKARQRPLARGLEEALGREFLLELLERELQSAVSLRLEKLDQQLIFATRFENIDAPTRQHRHAVGNPSGAWSFVHANLTQQEEPAPPATTITNRMPDRPAESSAGPEHARGADHGPAAAHR